ncbi:MAG: ComF family protein [Bacteroidota bacterium]
MQETGFHQQEQDNELYYRMAGKTPLAGASALYYFDKQSRFKKVIQALKYKNQPEVGQFLGEMYGTRLKGALIRAQVKAIVPVPLHPSRLRERGYNQSAEIAKGLHRTTGIAVVEGALVRRDKTTTQTRKGQHARFDNVRDVFQVKRPLSGNLLLIDDVVTTGATLESCIRTLYAQNEPPKSVRVAALGMARHE